MSVGVWIGVAIAGAVGAVARYVVATLVADRVSGVMPWGTFVVNMSGAFVLGFITGLALYHAFPTSARAVLGTGFCGGYTTFSTFTFETAELAEEGNNAEATWNVVASVVAGLTAAAAGLAIAAL